MKPWKIVVIVLSSIVGAGLLIMLISLFSMRMLTSGTSSVTNAAPAPKGDYVAALHISGTISASGDSEYNQAWLLDSLNKITQDSSNVGLLLVIDTPGGSVYECDEVYLKVLDYKATGRPVYTSMGSTCASGGYYIAAASDQIYANRNTLTGSIGVSSTTFVDVTGLLERYGIRVKHVTSGKNKAMGSYVDSFTQEQIDIMQSISDETYNQFVGIVAEGRGMTVDQVKALADGRVYSAQQALDNKLIDGIANLDQVKDKMCEAEGLGDAEFVDYAYSYQPSLWDYLVGALNAKGQVETDLDQIQELLNSQIQMPQYLAPIADNQ